MKTNPFLQLIAMMLVMLMAGTAPAWANPTVRKSIFNPVDTYLYPDNMTMVIQLKDGETVVDTCEVAAFIGDECRGTTRSISGLYFLLVSGQGGGQTITLRTCLNGEIVTIDDTQVFVSDATIGNPWTPYVIDLQHLNTEVIKGDVNGDGIVNNADVVLIISYLSSLTPHLSLEAADVNGDGKVDVADIIAVIKETSNN